MPAGDVHGAARGVQFEPAVLADEPAAGGAAAAVHVDGEVERSGQFAQRHVDLGPALDPRQALRQPQAVDPHLEQQRVAVRHCAEHGARIGPRGSGDRRRGDGRGGGGRRWRCRRWAGFAGRAHLGDGRLRRECCRGGEGWANACGKLAQQALALLCRVRWWWRRGRRGGNGGQRVVGRERGDLDDRDDDGRLHAGRPHARQHVGKVARRSGGTEQGGAGSGYADQRQRGNPHCVTSLAHSCLPRAACRPGLNIAGARKESHNTEGGDDDGAKFVSRMESALGNVRPRMEHTQDGRRSDGGGGPTHRPCSSIAQTARRGAGADEGAEPGRTGVRTDLDRPWASVG
ncbi:hypothetical protein TSO221_03490 [Azospirillum sp. TSO22-1]|nr:hypothetical protein TSO221_03490 [Azospirillum sp. TSO22-1]